MSIFFLPKLKTSSQPRPFYQGTMVVSHSQTLYQTLRREKGLGILHRTIDSIRKTGLETVQCSSSDLISRNHPCLAGNY